jgi:hypothetical protein
MTPSTNWDREDLSRLRGEDTTGGDCFFYSLGIIKMQKCFPLLPMEIASSIFRINRMHDFKKAILKFDKIYRDSMALWSNIETICSGSYNDSDKRSNRYIITKSIVYHGGFKMLDIANVGDEELYTVTRYIWHPEFRSYEYYTDHEIDHMFDDFESDEDDEFESVDGG